MASTDEVLAIASKEIGYRESGTTNRTKYGAWYGLDGEPWCAMFLSWVFAQAGMPQPASTSKGFAYTPAGAAWYQSKGRWGRTPRVGAVVFFQFPGSSRINHVAIVESFRPGGYLTCIEGNTNSAGSRDGGGVMRKSRRPYVVGYGYPDYSEAEPIEEWPNTMTNEEQSTLINKVAWTADKVGSLERELAAVKKEMALYHTSLHNQAVSHNEGAIKLAYELRNTIAGLMRKLFGVDPVAKNDDQQFWKRQPPYGS